MSANLGKCAICGWRKAAGRVPVYASTPELGAGRFVAPGIRTKVLSNGMTHRVLRDEPWCRDCGRRVLAAMGDGPFVWRHVKDGWTMAEP